MDSVLGLIDDFIKCSKIEEIQKLQGKISNRFIDDVHFDAYTVNSMLDYIDNYISELKGITNVDC